MLYSKKEVPTIGVPFKNLVKRGYTFQKLYAANYRCYHKKLTSGRTLWAWVKGKSIELDGLYSATLPCLKFLKHEAHKYAKPSVREGGLTYIVLYYNPETLHVFSTETGRELPSRSFIDYLESEGMLRVARPTVFEEDYLEKGYCKSVFNMEELPELLGEVEYLIQGGL